MVSLFAEAVRQTAGLAAAPAAAGPTGIGALAAVRGVLGIDGKSAARPQANLLSSRARRFKMQRHAQRLLPEEAVNGCHINMGMKGSVGGSVPVLRDAEHGGVKFGLVHTCGSVWHCPVCATRIAERRRAELAAGIVTHRARGGSVVLLTLTFPHGRDDSLNANLDMLSAALSKFKGSGTFTRCMKAIGSKGSVRALEVTNGLNGWHPHTHQLVFATVSESAAIDAVSDLRLAWSNACVKAGLGLPNDRGFDVRGGSAAADYVSKFGDASGGTWDVSHELTKAHIKHARSKGRTPFALLYDAMRGDAHAGFLFIEFAECFKGRRQLFFSPGLKEYLGIDQASDEQVADTSEREGDVLLWRIPNDDWVLLCKTNLRGELLDIADRHGTAGCYEFFRALRERRAGVVPHQSR